MTCGKEAMVDCGLIASRSLRLLYLIFSQRAGWLMRLARLSAARHSRRVSAGAGHLSGHRAPMEHRGRRLVLHPRLTWGSGDGGIVAQLAVRLTGEFLGMW